MNLGKFVYRITDVCAEYNLHPDRLMTLIDEMEIKKAIRYEKSDLVHSLDVVERYLRKSRSIARGGPLSS